MKAKNKKPTKAELAHIMLVKSMPCVVCDEHWYDRMIEQGEYFVSGKGIRCEFDHLVDGYRLGHMFGLPLCHAHHVGKKGYSGGIKWDSSKPNQWRLLEKVYKVLGKEMPEYTTKGRNNFKESEC